VNQELLSPLSYYNSVAKEKHSENVSTFFEGLLSRSGIDTAKNAATVKKYNAQSEKVNSLNKKLKRLKVLRVFMIIFAVIGFILFLVGANATEAPPWLRPTFIATGLVLAASMLLLIFLKVNKTVKRFDSVLEKESLALKALYEEALSEVRPLLLLFTDFDAQRLVEKTLPDVKFDEQFNLERFDELTEKYDYAPPLSPDVSVSDTLSGMLGTSPFLYETRKIMVMGSETYHGYRTISWTTMERDSNGRMRSVRHTDTLHASVTKPKPGYETETRLNFGHHAAPKLKFSRAPSHSDDLSERALKKKINKGEDKLEKREREALTDNDPTTNFTKLANSEFEVLLSALDRTDEQEYRLLYTPLAQTETTKLLLDKDNFGDDFMLIKSGRNNIVISEHTSRFSLDARTENYFSHDYSEIKRKFISYNNEYFKSIYFDFAPLLSIPAYHADNEKSFEKYINMHTQNYPTAEYEVLANRLREPSMIPHGCDTEVIFKARPLNRYGDVDNAEIVGRGFNAVPRTDLIPVLGGDGRLHTVAVNWLEYLPVEKSTYISVKRVGLSTDEFYERAGEDLPSGTVYHGLYAVLAEDMKDGAERVKALL